MMERRQVVAYILGSALVLALVALATWRARVAAPQSELQVAQVQGHPDRYQTSFETMGTDATLTVVASDAEAARSMFTAAKGRIDDVNRLMSDYLPESEISRLNRDGSAVVSDETLAVLRKSAEVSRLSGGAFDITYAPLRELWRKAAANGKLPTPEQLQKARAAVGYDKLSIEGNEVRFSVPGMEVDLGGIAKGYAVDLAAQALQQAGAKAGIVDIGHNLNLFGLPAGEKSWRVEIYPPPGLQQAPIVDLPPCGVATSGDYARGFRVGDQWFSHIIDPRTGRPVEHMSSVSIIAPDATAADGLSTAVSVMGWPRGMELVESLPGVECLMMVRKADGNLQEHESSGFSKYYRGKD
jgi:thiamine biosynthesis lipoprotein